MMVTPLTTVSCVWQTGCQCTVFRWQSHVFTFLLNINADDWLGRTTEQFGHWAVALNTRSLDDEGSAEAHKYFSCWTHIRYCPAVRFWQHFAEDSGLLGCDDTLSLGEGSAVLEGLWCVRNTRNHSRNDKTLHPGRQKSLNWLALCGSDTCLCKN